MLHFQDNPSFTFKKTLQFEHEDVDLSMCTIKFINIKVFAFSKLFLSCVGNNNGHQQQHYRTVCYFEGWSHLRDDPVQFEPEDVDPTLCTHIIFAFAQLDDSGLHIVEQDPNSDIQK